MRRQQTAEASFVIWLVTTHADSFVRVENCRKRAMKSTCAPSSDQVDCLRVRGGASLHRNAHRG